jgi:HEAT repeat protein
MALTAALWTAASAASAAESPSPAAPVAAPSAADSRKDDVAPSALRDFLIGPDRTFSTRRDAADALLEKDTPAARAVLVQVLEGPMPRDVTLAVLEALAAREKADEEFVAPLAGLLGSDDESVRRAAAMAFGAYQGSDRVQGRLATLASSAAAPAPHRLAAITALSRLIDKHSISTLVRLASDPQPPVAAAAATALAEMTGLENVGPSPQAWAEWWKRHEQDPEAMLLATLLRRANEEARRREAVMDRLQARLIKNLTDQYLAADSRQKGKLILDHVEDAVPQVRALAARQATALAREVLASGNGAARQANQDVIAAVTKHVNDESPAVRAAVAESLGAWKDPSAAGVLLARLDVEKVPEVRAALAGALGSLKVAEAAPRLAAMLDSGNETEVLLAAGALGVIGEKGQPGAAAVGSAVPSLGRLARSASSPAVREAACQAIARIATPAVEDVLAGALGDTSPSVRFSAAQGLANVGKVSDTTAAALATRLSDENKGVRQAVAGALAKVGGAEAARLMVDRLKAGVETEPTVRTALWESARGLVDRAESADLARDLGERFFAREGAEDMQRAAILFEAAIAKLPAPDRTGPAGRAILEKIVDAYLAAKMPDSAIKPLRQLIAAAPADQPARLRQLQQQLGLLLLAKEPYADAVPPLVAALSGATTGERQTILKDILVRAEALMKADRVEPAMDLLTAFGKAQADWGGGETGDALRQLSAQATAATVSRAVTALGGTEEQAAAAMITLRKVGPAARPRLLDTLETAAREKKTDLETRTLAALEAVTGRKDHGYDPAAPLEERLKQIATLRQSI